MLYFLCIVNWRVIVMPRPPKSKVLNWYRGFKADLKEKYSIDINKKNDALRIASCVTVDPFKGKHNLSHAFIRQNNGVYAVPEPADPSAKEMYDLAVLNTKGLEQGGEPQGDEPDYTAIANATAAKLFEKRNEWMVVNQEVFDPEKDEDYEQIERIYNDAHNGNLIVLDNNGNIMQNSFSLYVADDGTLCNGPRLDEAMAPFRISENIQRTYNPDGLMALVIKGEIDIESKRDKYSADYIRGMEVDNAAIMWAKENIEGINDLTPEDEELKRQYTSGEIEESKPKEVAKPGVFSWFKRFISFGFATGDFDDYKRYQSELGEWQQRSDTAKAAVEKYNKTLDSVKKKLINTDKTAFANVSDPDRRLAIFRNQERLTAAVSYSKSNLADDVDRYNKSQPRVNEDIMPQDAQTAYNNATVTALSTAIIHPEFYNANGTLNADGKINRKNLAMTPDEKKEAIAAAREKTAKAREIAYKSLTQIYEQEDKAYANAIRSDKMEIADNTNMLKMNLGILVYSRVVERQLEKGNYIRECAMTPDDIAAYGRAFSDNKAFEAMTEKFDITAHTLALYVNGYESPNKERFDEELNKLCDAVINEKKISLKKPAAENTEPVKQNAEVEKKVEEVQNTGEKKEMSFSSI